MGDFQMFGISRYFSLRIWCFVTLADLPSSPVGVGLTQANFRAFLLTETFAFTLSPIRLAPFQEWAFTATWTRNHEPARSAVLLKV